MTVHNFKDSLQVGEEHEKKLDQFFSQWFDIKPATQAEQRRGIDRFFTRDTNGERFSVEYKTDLRAHETGNAYIETVSVKNETTFKPGWLYTCTAQRLLYYVPGLKLVYILDVMELRSKAERGWSAHKKAYADNGDYVGEGLLVPMKKIAKMAIGRMKV